jgi:flagellar basal-body rod modification protein FlgD
MDAPIIGQDRAATSPAAPPSRPGSTLAGDLDTFLNLLTAQMKNQDPLEPADASAFTAQLATFSNVEQAIRTNDLLADMIGRLDVQGLSQAAGWIGREARVTGPVAYDGAPVELSLDVPPGADAARLVIRDARGAELGRQTVAATSGTHVWDGTDGQGRALPAGRYELAVEASAGDQELTVPPVAHYARVVEVAQGEAGPEILLAAGGRVSADAVTALRR